jgi:hypothetical protein
MLEGMATSMRMWGRTAGMFDMEEHDFKTKKLKQPDLFSDSMELTDKTTEKDKFPMLKLHAKWGNEFMNTEHYNQNYAVQKYQTMAASSALNKVSYVVTFSSIFVNVRPLDKVKLDVENRLNDEQQRKHKELSSEYLVTKVIHRFRDGFLSTELKVGRDTFVKS